MTGDGKFLEPSSLDRVKADHGPPVLTFEEVAVRPQALVLQNRWEVVKVSDMEDQPFLNVYWHRSASSPGGEACFDFARRPRDRTEAVDLPLPS